MPDPIKNAFLSETLFHFLGTAPDDSLFEIFDSVVRSGLLLTVGNREGKLDRFVFYMRDGTEKTLEVMQHPRVCFTDIPEDKLVNLSDTYGKFGLGFSRSKIISWGWHPVMYMSNHAAADSMQEIMGSALFGLDRAAIILDLYRSFLTEDFKKIVNPSLSMSDMAMEINGQVFEGKARDDLITHARNSVHWFLSFVKEMSSQSADDYRYLYEREWRIVAGAERNGKSSCRVLNQEEKNRLRRMHPRWADRLEPRPSIGPATERVRMLDAFRFFNGLDGQTVSQAIEVILVPNEALKTQVKEYVEIYPRKFCDSGPEIRIFGE